MTRSISKLSEVKRTLQNETLNFKRLNDAEDLVIFTDASIKATDEVIGEYYKQSRKYARLFNEGEVFHWLLINYENVERLIDTSSVTDYLSIHLTTDHNPTLKNIAYDKNFMHESRFSDRKQVHANRICSKFSCLHKKSLSLMNFCDDNVMIFKVNNRTNISDFDLFICELKSGNPRLNVQEMYLPPKECEFDSITEVVDANGTLMLDMVLSHLLPWAIIDCKPVKAINNVDNMSLDLLQPGNAGVVVTTLDFAEIKKFLKRFLRQNPQESIPVTHVYNSSFLQNRYRCKIYRDSRESLTLPEDLSSLDFYTPNLLNFYNNPTYNPRFNSIVHKTQKRKAEKVDVAPNTLIIETQQAERQVQFGVNETAVDISHRGSLKNSIKLEISSKMPLLPCYIAIFTNSETNEDFQKISKSWEAVNSNTKSATASSYDCYQSTKSPNFVKPKEFYNANTFKKFSNSNFYLNNKYLSTKQSVEWDFPSTDISLNLSYNNNYDAKNRENYSVYSKDGANSFNKSGSEKVGTIKRHSEIVKTQQFQNQTKNKQRIPFQKLYRASLQTFERLEVNPPSNSTFCIFPTSEIEPVINTFLRRCYVSIQAHEKALISNEFSKIQSKFIKEYKNSDLRLCQMIMMKYEWKLEDVKQLMKCSYLKMINESQCKISMNNSFFYIIRNNFLQSQGTKNAMKDSTECYKFENKNKLIMRPDKNCSYYEAIENAENIRDSKWEINGKTENENNRKECEEIHFDSENKMKHELISDKIKKENYVDIKMQEMVTKYETMKEYAQNIEEEQWNTGTRPKIVKNKNVTSKEKINEIITNVNPAKSKKNSNKNKVKGETEMEPTNKKLTVEKKNNEKKINGKLDTKEKNMREHKKLEKPKRSWFSWFRQLCIPW